ncbi:hypothetical protein ACTXT7_017340 [Hymenolepis weldensis]
MQRRLWNTSLPLDEAKTLIQVGAEDSEQRGNRVQDISVGSTNLSSIRIGEMDAHHKYSRPLHPTSTNNGERKQNGISTIAQTMKHQARQTRSSNPHPIPNPIHEGGVDEYQR